MTAHRPHPPAAFGASVLVAALLLQLPLVLNPGYFSHDELQWAAFADAGIGVPWLDFGVFQYRPLTFNLWMALSRALFDAPMLFHAALVLWGSANAALLAVIARGFGLRAWPAALGALCFALGPNAVYVHGWVGCIGDLIWLSCALLIALLVRRGRRAWCAAAIAAALTAVALLGKEAAFAIPPLLAVGWLFDGRKHTWLAAMLAAGAVCALYLGLRLDVLLHAPREGTQYTLSIANVPLRWLEYQLFPPIVPLSEAFNTLSRPGPAAIAGLLWLGLLAALWQASPRWTALFVLGGIAALSPVLPLGSAFNHYAYGFAAVASMAAAAAWATASRMGRVAIALYAAFTVLHGARLMDQIRDIGIAQANFSPALAEAVAASTGVVVLQVAPDAKEWVFRRLSHSIPRYHGVEIGDRVRLVEAGAPADYRIEADGRLSPLARSR